MMKLPTQQTRETRQTRQFKSSQQSDIKLDQSKLYKITCKGSHMALQTQIRKKQLPQDQLRIIGSIQRQDNIKQLWLFKSLKQNKYQIINFYTDLVLQSEQDNGVKLDKGKQKALQKFQIQPVNRQFKPSQRFTLNNLCKIIKIKDYNSLYITLDGLLQSNKSEDTNQNQVFYIKEINTKNYDQFNSTFFIVNPQTRKCLDVTKGDDTIGTAICLYDINHRANQRWSIQPQINNEQQQNTKYSIINMLTNLRLWYDKKYGLIQSNNTQKVWQIHKKHDNSGQLYQTLHKKYINKIEFDKLSIESHSNGTKWVFQFY